MNLHQHAHPILQTMETIIHIAWITLPLSSFPFYTCLSLHSPIFKSPRWPKYIHMWLCHWRQQFLMCKIWRLFIILEHSYIIPPPRLTNILQVKLMAFQQTTFFPMTNQPTCTYLQTTLLFFISFIITSPFHITPNKYILHTILSNIKQHGYPIHLLKMRF